MPLVGSGVNQSHDCQVGALPFARAGILPFPAVFPIAFVNVARVDAPAKQVVPVLVSLSVWVAACRQPPTSRRDGS